MDLTGPGAPLDNPLAWTILAWTRRTFFNEPNDAATPAAVNATATAVTPIVQEPVDISSPNASGAVTVNIVATDPLGRPLTYWVLTPPAPATGAVTTNATPGEFTYTPTTDARVSAATGGPTSLAIHSCERIHCGGDQSRWAECHAAVTAQLAANPSIVVM